jgi:predicted nuclease of predicted toxin-antitoxin system
VRFLIDAQLPPALAKALIEAGHDAEHVESAGLRHAGDADIWNYALNNQRAIITKDEDFASRSLVAAHSPRIVWVRVPNCSKRQLLRWLLPEMRQIVQAFEAGNTLVEINKA